MQIIRTGLARRSYSYICTLTPSHHHHCANLSEDIELIKCLSDIFCGVCKIRHIISVIPYIIRKAVCYQFTHFPCEDWENIYTLSYYHHQIGNINYYPLLMVRSWKNGVGCMSVFFWNKCFIELNVCLQWFCLPHWTHTCSHPGSWFSKNAVLSV